MKNIIIIALLAASEIQAMSLFQSEEPEIKIPQYTPPPVIRKPMACLNRDEMIKQGVFYCPRPTELTKEGMKWNAPNPWKAYSESFVDIIDKFTGAQWSGPSGTVGRLVCFYSGIQKDTFPVKITTTVLIQLPTLPVWDNISKTPDDTIVNCVSVKGEVCDCPFSIVQNAESSKSSKT